MRQKFVPPERVLRRLWCPLADHIRTWTFPNSARPYYAFNLYIFFCKRSGTCPAARSNVSGATRGKLRTQWTALYDISIIILEVLGGSLLARRVLPGAACVYNCNIFPSIRVFEPTWEHLSCSYQSPKMVLHAYSWRAYCSTRDSFESSFFHFSFRRSKRTPTGSTVIGAAVCQESIEVEGLLETGNRSLFMQIQSFISFIRNFWTAARRKESCPVLQNNHEDPLLVGHVTANIVPLKSGHDITAGIRKYIYLLTMYYHDI